MSSRSSGPSGEVFSDRFLLLQRFLENPPPQANFNTMYQTTAFVKGEDKKSFREQAETVAQVSQPTLSKPYSPFQEQTIYHLMNQYEKAVEAYKIKKFSVNFISIVNPIGGFIGKSIGQSEGGAFMKGFLSVAKRPYSQKLEFYDRESQRYADQLLSIIATDEERKLIENASNIDDQRKLLRALLVTKVPGAHAIPEEDRDDFIGFLARCANKFKGKPKPSKKSDESPQVMVQQTIVMIKNLQQAPKEIEQALQESSDAAQATLKEYQAIRHYLSHINKQSEESLKINRFLADIQYKNLTTTEKREAIERGIYPDRIGELDTLRLIEKWENAEKKVDLFAGIGVQGIKVLSQLGVKIPKHLEKVPLANQAAFQVIKGLTFGNPMAVIQGAGQLIGLFRSSGPDISTLRHQQLVDLLSNVIDNQQIMIGMIDALQQQVDELFRLNIGIAQAVNEIGFQILKNHAEVMAKLQRINHDLLYVQSVVVHRQLDFFHDFEDLVAARTDYPCQYGIFETHAAAQAYFRRHISQFNSALKRVRDIFDPKALDPLLLFNSAFTQGDEIEIPGTKSHFLYTVWQSSFDYYNEFLYQELDQKKRESMFPAFFEPMVLFDDLPDLLVENVKLEGDLLPEIYQFCSDHLDQLLLPFHILRTGGFLLDFSRYDPLIKDHLTGTLFSLEELLEAKTTYDHNQKRGRRLLENLLSHVNLAIVQQHLLSGGPLILRTYENFFSRLSEFAELMNSAEGVQEQEKEALRGQMYRTVRLLAHNPMFARNAVLYALRAKLHMRNTDPDCPAKCLNYRIAYNHSADSRALKSLFPGWDFVPSPDEQGNSGWALRCPFVVGEEGQELRLQLPHPSDLFYGKLMYPIDLLQLVELREAIIQELACNDLPKLIKSEEEKKLLADRIIVVI